MDVQDVMRLEVERALERRHSEGGGGVFFSVQDWAERFEISQAVVCREFGDLLEQNPGLSVTFEIFGSTASMAR